MNESIVELYGNESQENDLLHLSKGKYRIDFFCVETDSDKCSGYIVLYDPSRPIEYKVEETSEYSSITSDPPTNPDESFTGNTYITVLITLLIVIMVLTALLIIVFRKKTKVTYIK